MSTSNSGSYTFTGPGIPLRPDKPLPVKSSRQAESQHLMKLSKPALIQLYMETQDKLRMLRQRLGAHRTIMAENANTIAAQRRALKRTKRKVTSLKTTVRKRRKNHG
jgi:hypothetical protein